MSKDINLLTLVLGAIWVGVGKKSFICGGNSLVMNFKRNENSHDDKDHHDKTSKRKLSGNKLLAVAFAAMIAAMVPTISAISGLGLTGTTNAAQAADMVDKPYVKVLARNALFEPNAGKTNVFGPGGIFPFFNDTFSCGNAVTCGVSIEDATFKGVFKEAGEKADNRFAAEYVAPLTYGDQQIKGNKYRIELIDTMWNNPSTDQTPLPTRVPAFLEAGKGVAFDQVQHGHSMVDRADVPMFMNRVALYGHVNVYDITDGQKKVVAQNLFAHLMVGKVIDENSFFTNFQANPATQYVVALFVVNIPSGVKLPGDIGPLTPEQAQSFTPLANDSSLANAPPFNYDMLMQQGVKANQPLPQSTIWPVDNPTQPLFFTFLLFTETRAGSSATNTVPGLD